MEDDATTFEVRNRIATVTLNRPARLNAIGQQAREELIAHFARVNDDEEIWAAVVTGAGTRAFSVGGDLKEMSDYGRERTSFPVPMGGTQRNLYESLLEVYKPTIAAVDGYAIAGGFELAMACDLRVAGRGSQFGMPEAQRGLGANFASVVLPRLVPRGIALELLYTGRFASAEEAERWGLVNSLVEDGAALDAALALAERLTANAPLSLRRYKHMATKGWELPVSAALRLDAGPNPYVSADREEGVAAFNAGREPQWAGR
ncbi:enoyl-CoA hydratase/isomerase family protein [Egibacter rhizosphaerae]|uniref:enoyl-CoA hydratase/isomerase family protein n=1 Tax=Egibacter rhizosphaerae TaxID=1670831 RepID=UPI00197AD871|nr:enoyl-CoA hydratase/isomerase family protein [Egibacter rhizosphaerae]